MVINENYMQNSADDITSLYSNLEKQIFNRIIFYLKDSSYKDVDKDNVLMWQAEQLSKMGMLTDDVIKLLSEVTGKAEPMIKKLINDNGIEIEDDLSSQLSNMMQRSKISIDSTALLGGLMTQTYSSMNNVVNQSLISRNYGQNSATRTYQDIINKSTIETIVGLKTHEQAVFDNVNKWVKAGMKTNLVDKAGHNWSLEGYTRMVINTAAHNTYNKTRMNVMDKYGVTLAMMSSHAASRPACAPIQGLVINTIPTSDPRYNPKYDSIYNHGYGEAGGTQGINCHHELFPYIEGVSTNPFHHPDTEQAIENGKIQQKQRALERRIRNDKKSLKYTRDLKDVGGSYKYKNLLGRHRSELRNLVNDNSFLNRDYKREKIATELSDKKKKDIRFSIKSDEAYLRQLKDKFGSHGLPDNVEEYRRLIYNKDSSRAVKAYIQARQGGVVEPVVTYKDFITRTKELDNRIVGMTASDGTVITDYSNHTIARTFGALHDKSHKNNKRIGVSIDNISNDLKNGHVRKSEGSKKFIGSNSHVIVNKNGNIVTVVPRNSQRRRK